MRISVIGSGTWGVALSKLLIKNNNSVINWVHSEELKNQILLNYELHTLPGVKIPKEIEFSCDYEKVLYNTEMILVVVASPYVRQTIKDMKNYIKDDTIIVCASKGIERDSLYTMTEVIIDELKTEHFTGINTVCLSGPTHAEEVACDMPSMIASASSDDLSARIVQDTFMNENFRVYTNDDIKGVKISGALKNIYALCCDVSEGLGYGDNLKAAIMTRGLAEIIRLGTALKCKKETFYGLAGLGDLIVTSTSRHSRNNKCGRLIGSGVSVKEAIDNVGMVVKGINCLPAAMRLIEDYNIDMQIY